MASAVRYTVAGAAALAALAVSIYVVLASESGPQADPLYVQQCRDLTRQVMDLYVEAARAGLDAEDPADAQRIEDFDFAAAALQDELDGIGCSTNPEKWAYGSFKQEMVETERYIADLLRDGGTLGGSE